MYSAMFGDLLGPKISGNAFVLAIAWLWTVLQIVK